MINDEINILAQVDVHIGTHTELASQLGPAVSTLNIVVKKIDKNNWKLQNNEHSRIH
jgi:hypothetical protein